MKHHLGLVVGVVMIAIAAFVLQQNGVFGGTLKGDLMGMPGGSSASYGGNTATPTTTTTAPADSGGPNSMIGGTTGGGTTGGSAASTCSGMCGTACALASEQCEQSCTEKYGTNATDCISICYLSLGVCNSACNNTPSYCCTSNGSCVLTGQEFSCSLGSGVYSESTCGGGCSH